VSDTPHAEPAAAHDAVDDEPIPAGQRFFDNIFVLLALGVVIMFVLYTGWGLWEILTLPKTPLP
jgi:hypothetical protein